MTPQQIAKACRRQQKLLGRADAAVAFYMRGNWGRSYQRRLWKGGPLGTIVAQRDGQLTVMFRADEVLAALPESGASQ